MAWNYQVTDSVPWAHMSQTGNAMEVYNYWKARGATDHAISGILGNMESESYLNPGQGELGHNMSDQYGLGLIQWTPSGHKGSNPLKSYCTLSGLTWFDGSAQMLMMEYDSTSGAWIKTSQYPYSWSEFLQLTDIDTATKAYFYERERGTWNDVRLTYANDWYQIITGQEPEPPTPPTPPGPGPYNPQSYLWAAVGGAAESVRRRLMKY